MHYNIFNEYPRIGYQENRNRGYVRVFHAVPDAPNVDVYADGNLFVSNLPYSDYSNYLSVPEGNYEIAVYPAGSKNNPVLRNMLSVSRNSMQTVAAVGTLDTIGLLAVPDATMRSNPSKSTIRFMHLSPNAPAVDITLPDGSVLFSNVSFRQLTPYIEVPPGIYTLQARLAGTQTVALSVPNVKLDSNKIYTVYAIGLVGEEPELEALLVPDGNIINNSR